jgi:hypothetical protein
MHLNSWCAHRPLHPSLHRLLFVTALAAVGAVSAEVQAQAQAPSNYRLDPTPTLQATQASTPVAPAVYRSVFADLPQDVEEATLDWKAANAAVGQFKRGHIDLLKWEQEQARELSRQTTRQPTPPPTPRAPGVQP